MRENLKLRNLDGGSTVYDTFFWIILFIDVGCHLHSVMQWVLKLDEFDEPVLYYIVFCVSIPQKTESI